MTVTNDCHHLDGYLDGELAPGEAARFAAHLDECPTCREAVDEQQWIDGLLRAPAIAQLQTPPTALVEFVRRAHARRLQIRRSAMVAAAAAATVLVAVGWFAMLNRQADGGRVASVAVSNEPSATFVGGPDVIVVPVASRNPDVTIVRIYPTFQPDIFDQAGTDLPAADELIWPELFNGG